MALGAPISNDRKIAADFRRLALEYGINFWSTADEKEKKELFFRLAPNLIPRLHEVTGDEGGEIVIKQIVGMAIK